jgi:site-specific DNA recombinase
LIRVCLYTRISTDEENQPTSLHSQRERLHAFVASQEGWRIVAHEEDRATGTKLERPGLQAALDLARSGRIDLLLVYRVDRLSRKVRQLAQLADELDKVNVVLRSATEPFDTGSAAGRMMLQMLAVFAEFEHATIVDRISAGIERRATEGRWFAGRPPYGYTLDAVDKRMLPDPVKGPLVRRIFDLYVGERLGTTAIAKLLRAQGSPPPSAGWSHPGVHFILTNPTYTGRIRWRESLFEGTHEPLVDVGLFEQAQAILAERGEDVSRRRGNASDFLLSGLVRCGKCGRAYVGMSAKGNGGVYHYYACTGRQKYGPKACNGDRLPSQKLEQAVVHQLCTLYRDGSLISDALAGAAKAASGGARKRAEQLAQVRAERARIGTSIERYFEAFEQGTLNAQRCEERIARLQARLDTLAAQEADLALASAEPAEAPGPKELAAVADRLEHVITTEPAAKSKALLRLLIDELQVNSRSEIQPTYRIVTPAVCVTSEKVERIGIEPMTSALQRRRSPS